MELPEGLKFTEDHIWIKKDGKKARLGITNYAQDELGDVVFVDLPQEGEEYSLKEVFGTVESIKTVSDLFMPVKGLIISVNQKLLDNPELINKEPYREGWIVEIKIQGNEEKLISRQKYKSIIS